MNRAELFINQFNLIYGENFASVGKLVLDDRLFPRLSNDGYLPIMTGYLVDHMNPS